MKRGDLVTIAMPGDYGKARPAVVIQADIIADSDSVLVCQLTSDPTEALFRRVPVAANRQSGLKTPSQVMVEKIFAVRRDKCGKVIGKLDSGTLVSLNEALAVVIGLAD